MSYARVVLYSLNSGTFDETMEIVRGGLLPLFSEQSGFESYRVVDGGEQIVSASIWATREDAERATSAAAEWVRENLADRISAQQTVVGEVTELR